MLIVNGNGHHVGLPEVGEGGGGGETAGQKYPKQTALSVS